MIELLPGSFVRASAVVASAPLPEVTAEEIRKELELIFGSSAVTIRFAVRSSACGEDSEDMSAAGWSPLRNRCPIHIILVASTCMICFLSKP